ncbi:mambaquaretin-2-like [Haemaphysalis longicornis]
MLRRTVMTALLVVIALSGGEAEDRPAVCYLPPHSGLCIARYPSFFFDNSTGTCREFTYGGCRGNENRFSTLEECVRVCG